MYKTALFDFDGTVFETGEGIMKSVQYAAEAFGYPEPDWRAAALLRRTAAGRVLRRKIQCGRGDGQGHDEKVPRALQRGRRERVRALPRSGAAGQDSEGTGAECGGRNGKPTAFTVEILRSHGLDGLFDDVLGSEFDGTRGQKWEVITELLGRFGRDGAVMIGDRENDVRGAKRCGIPCIGVSWGYAEPGELEKAGAVTVVNSVDELRNILLG